jgi:hypothetical protein
MRKLSIALVLTATVLQIQSSGRAPDGELNNVAAFARLFGVVRYFYPSDRAASLDWNRFAVAGVQQVRTAADARALESALDKLFQPLGPGIEIGRTLSSTPVPATSDEKLIAWRYFGPGFDGSNPGGPYQGKRTNRARALGAGIDGFVTLMQTVSADTLRGKIVRFRGQVRAAARDPMGRAALWLRVDRPAQTMGFFDNMGDRPIRDPEWREYGIEGTVAEDATNVAFGVMASGTVDADFDVIELSVRDSDGTWKPIAIADAGFEDEAAAKGWTRAGTSKVAQINRLAQHAPEGKQFVRLSAPAPGVTHAELFEDSAPSSGEHADVDLGSGLKARVPLVLTDSQAASGAKHSLEVRATNEQTELNTRLADVVVAWNVFRHFYPYWTEAAVDWDTRLRPHLERAYAASGREAHRDALRLLVSDVRDGHGSVNDPRGTRRSTLPVRLDVIENRVVVVASSAPDVPIGAVVSAIDDVPADERLSAAIRLQSGTTQWQRVRALQEISTCPAAGTATLLVDDGAGPRARTVRCDAKSPPAEQRPQPISELAPGVWYVDITRARMSEVAPVLDRLAKATGVIFDVRGYPTDAGAQILPHLMDASEADRWMHVPKIVGPFGRTAGWHSVGWNVKPSPPRLSGKIVFLTDGRAISYAESVMGYVADRKLGTIVGSATAGANGNVAMFDVPGGFRVAFTGMRVTGHDGQAAHHLVGIKPDVPVAPTIAGLRAGRDEVLERGLARIKF